MVSFLKGFHFSPHNGTYVSHYRSPFPSPVYITFNHYYYTEIREWLDMWTMTWYAFWNWDYVYRLFIIIFLWFTGNCDFLNHVIDSDLATILLHIMLFEYDCTILFKILSKIQSSRQVVPNSSYISCLDINITIIIIYYVCTCELRPGYEAIQS